MPPQEPVRGVSTYLEHPGILSLPGFEQMRRFQHRDLPYSPIWYLTGLEMTEFGVGTSTFRLPSTEWLRSAAGIMTGGALAFAADGALAGAICSTLDPGYVLATSDLALNFVHPPTTGDAIIARAGLIDVGRAQGLSEATIEDTDGHLLAHATSRCVLTKVPYPLPDPPTMPVPPLEYIGPHPFQRPAIGEVLPPDVWEQMAGIDVLRGWQRGELHRTPLSNLIGVEVTHAEDGAVVLATAASPWFGHMGGEFYGGALALLADYAIQGAVQSTRPAGTSWATLDLKVRFLRPVTPDGQPLEARAHLTHRGRRIAVAQAEIVTAKGRVAVLADASVMLLPGPPWLHMTTLHNQQHDLATQTHRTNPPG